MIPLSHVIPRVLAETLKQAPTSAGKVDFAWKSAVGPAIARGSAVRLEGTTLLVDTPSAEWAREVRRASSVILKRLRTILGDETVTEIVVRA